MSSDEPESPWPHSRHDAKVEDIITTLRRYGTLTRPRLADLCGAEHGSDPAFAQALALAVSGGRIRPLGNEVYETTDIEPPGPAPGTSPPSARESSSRWK